MTHKAGGSRGCPLPEPFPISTAAILPEDGCGHCNKLFPFFFFLIKKNYLNGIKIQKKKDRK